MNLIALLAWFDEPTDDLEHMIRGVHACGVTRLAAVDGAYGTFPGAHPVSSSLQHQTIVGICNEIGIDLRIYLPDKLWPREIEKRAFLFALAEHELRDSTDDWYWVIDADERVLNPFDLRPLLERTTENAADVRVVEPAGHGNPARDFDLRMLFRAVDGLTVHGTHSTYVAGDQILWGFGQEPSRDLTSLQVEHRTNLRSARRQRVKRKYYDDRDERGLEQQAGCHYCGQDATVRIRSGFTLAAENRLRSSMHLACDRHANRLRLDNRAQLQQIARTLGFDQDTDLRDIFASALDPDTWEPQGIEISATPSILTV